MNYPFVSMTTAGDELLAQTTGNKNDAPVIDKAIFSNQRANTNQPLYNLQESDFANPLFYPLVTVKHQENTVQPEVTLDNKDFNNNYPVYMIGILAHAESDTSGNEILYAVALTDDDPMIMPKASANRFACTFAIPIGVDNGNNVKIVTTDAGTVNDQDFDQFQSSLSSTLTNLSSTATSASSQAATNSVQISDTNVSGSMLFDSVDSLSDSYNSLSDKVNGSNSYYDSQINHLNNDTNALWIQTDDNSQAIKDLGSANDNSNSLDNVQNGLSDANTSISNLQDRVSTANSLATSAGSTTDNNTKQINNLSNKVPHQYDASTITDMNNIQDGIYIGSLINAQHIPDNVNRGIVTQSSFTFGDYGPSIKLIYQRLWADILVNDSNGIQDLPKLILCVRAYSGNKWTSWNQIN